MRGTGIQPNQLLTQPHLAQSQGQQQPTAHSLAQHPALAGHLYGNHVQGKQPGDQIRDVWASNLEQEFAHLRNIISHYPFVSMVRQLAKLDLWL
jgi:hypothetical protein